MSLSMTMIVIIVFQQEKTQAFGDFSRQFYYTTSFKTWGIISVLRFNFRLKKGLVSQSCLSTGPVVRRVDNTIRRINRYPADKS